MRRPDPATDIEEARRNGFREIATAVFARRGFEAPTMEELAAACGCDRRTLYRYFPSKEDLFWEAAERAYGALAARFKDASAVWESGRVSAIGRVRSWVFTYLGFSLERPEAFRLIMEGRQKAVATQARGRKAAELRLGKSGKALAEIDRAVLSTLSGIDQRLEAEGSCDAGEGEATLWELLGICLALIEFHARYRGGGATFPWGTPEGVRGMLERQITGAFGLREEKQ